MDSEDVYPLLYMTIEVAPGKNDLLPVYPADQPASLSKAFCQKHKLPPSLQRQVERLIASAMLSASRFQEGRRTVQSTSRALTRSQNSSFTPKALSTHGRGSEEPRNYGEWMYYRDQKKPKIAFHRQEKVTSEPPSRSYRKLSYSVEKLIQKGKESKQRLLEKRRLAHAEERKLCPFRPSLSVKSERLSRSRSADRPAFDRLFHDAKERTFRLSLQTKSYQRQECPFHPFTLSSRRQPEAQLSMIDRLVRSKVDFERAVAKVREEIETAEKPSFRPSIGREPSTQRHGSIYERLFVNGRDKKREDSEERGRNSRNMDDQSREIVQKYRKRQMEGLFQWLDQDRDGLVQLTAVSDLHGLDGKLTRILSPLWRLLLEKKEPVALEAFLTDVDQVLRDLSVGEKAYALRHMRERPRESLQQDSLSKETGRRSFTGVDVYARQMQERSVSADRLRKLREEKTKAEMKECTFRPTLTRYRRDPYLFQPI